jgi:uncharacterized membrane protein YgdD (TMEM256/DUF423 family)
LGAVDLIRALGYDCPMTLNRPLAAFAALNGAMAVMVGAFGAHGAGPAVKSLLTTVGQYQMVHALLAVACAAWPMRSRLTDVAGWLGASGGLIFCLALMMTARITAFGAVAPIGGALLIAAWLLLSIAALRKATPRA